MTRDTFDSSGARAFDGVRCDTTGNWGKPSVVKIPSLMSFFGLSDVQFTLKGVGVTLQLIDC